MAQRTKILIFEWLTGGGLWYEQILPISDDSIRSQGRLMLNAVVTDFLDAGCEVVVPIDTRLRHELADRGGLSKMLQRESDDLAANLAGLAEQVDCVMLVAPESNACLSRCITWVAPSGSKLISPDAEFVGIAANKKTTYQYLRAHGFSSIPEGLTYREFEQSGTDRLRVPMVSKPIDGAGSEGVRLITGLSELGRESSQSLDGTWLEPFMAGTPVSVSVLCGPREARFLPPTQQLFDRQPFGRYVGAGFPIDPVLGARAIRLAREVMKAMPQTRGYIGLDLVLSDRSENDDCLIEVNPRLTMSYLKLREVYPENLAKLMLEVASGA